MIVKSVQIDNNLHNAVNDAIASDKPVKVKTNAGNAVILSENTYNAIMETLYITSHPANVLGIKEGEKEKLSEMTKFDPNEEW